MNRGELSFTRRNERVNNLDDDTRDRPFYETRFLAIFRVPLGGYRNSRNRECTGEQWNGTTDPDKGSASPWPAPYHSQRQSGNTANGKRQRLVDEDDNDDDNDNKEIPDSHSLSVDSPGVIKRQLACPYLRNNPHAHHECGLLKLENIARLKQHLRRHHCQPKHCLRCGIEFANSHSEREHAQQVSACRRQPPRTYPGKMTEAQDISIKQRTPKGNSEEDNWYHIYNILFGDKQKFRSICIGDVVQEQLAALRQFEISNGPGIADEITARSLRPTGDSPGQHAVLQRRTILEIFHTFTEAYARHALSNATRSRENRREDAETALTLNVSVEIGTDPDLSSEEVVPVPAQARHAQRLQITHTPTDTATFNQRPDELLIGYDSFPRLQRLYSVADSPRNRADSHLQVDTHRSSNRHTVWSLENPSTMADSSHFQTPQPWMSNAGQFVDSLESWLGVQHNLFEGGNIGTEAV